MNKIKNILALIMAALVCLTALPVGAAVMLFSAPLARTAPAGYDEHDYNKLLAFLETRDSNGVKNGDKVSFYYDPADPESWGGCFTWTTGSVKKIKEFSANYYELAGNMDVAGCAALEKLYCFNNDLTAIDVTGCSALTELSCSGNRFTSLNVTQCPALRALNCSENRLTSLDVTNCPALVYFYCDRNQLSQLDVSHCAMLQNLDCNYNSISALDVTHCTELRELRCSDNGISALDVSHCAELESLHCPRNDIAELDVSACGSLLYLDCSDNSLYELDVTHCPGIWELYCSGNVIHELDLTGNPLIPLDRITAEGRGSIGLDFMIDDHYYSCYATAVGVGFSGWYSGSGELLTNDYSCNIYSTGDGVLTARFAGIIPGDADDNGVVNANDALLVLRFALNMPVGVYAPASDVNGDGLINALDALMILRAALGLLEL